MEVNPLQKRRESVHGDSDKNILFLRF